MRRGGDDIRVLKRVGARLRGKGELVRAGADAIDRDVAAHERVGVVVALELVAELAQAALGIGGSARDCRLVSADRAEVPEVAVGNGATDPDGLGRGRRRN